MTVVSGIYRRLLRLLPRDMHDAHGAEMEQLLADELTMARRRGPMARARVVAHAFLDVVRRAPYEHWRRRGRRDSAFGEPRLSFFSELRSAVRTLARQPLTSGLIVVTLTLAIAANTAVFAVVDAVFFRALPYENPSRLVELNETSPKQDQEFTGINYPDFVKWREKARVFESMGLWASTSFNVYDGTRAERIEGQEVTYDLPRTLGIQPVLGRAFTPQEDVPNGPNVVMIGYALWQARYAGSRRVLGQTIQIGGDPSTIIGVLPPNVALDGPAGIWVPLRGDARQHGESYSYEGVGRLEPGVTIDEAREDLNAAHEAVWQAADPARLVSPRIMPLRDRFVGERRTMAGTLAAAVLLVVFVACANVASTMLARSVLRRREMSVRRALGATTARLMRQLLAEAFVLVAVAALVGIVIGRAGLAALMSRMDPMPPWLHVTITGRPALLSMAVVLATTLLFATAPTLRFLQQDLSAAPGRGHGPGRAAHRARRLSSTLVVSEVALTAILLVVGGMFLRAHLSLRAVNPGFRVTGLATFRVSLTGNRYRDWPAQKRFYDQLIERIRALPDVDAAGFVTCPPFSCHWGKSFVAESAAAKSMDRDPVVLMRLASPDYFRTMGIRLLRGRFYGPTEGGPDGLRPAVINEELARQLWPGDDDPVRKRFTYRGDTSSRDWMTVTGVVRDARHYGLAQPMIGGFYLSTTAVHPANSFPNFAVTVHTTGDLAALFPALQRVMHDLDPALPIYSAQPMRVALDRSLASHRALTLSLGLFAVITLTLALGGIYAVLSYAFGQRRREIGIRLAVGAQGRQVFGEVVAQGLRLIAVGLLIGLPAAYVAAELISAASFGVTARDPLSYAIAAATLVVTGAFAAMVPAVRAARVDPRIVILEAT